MYTRNDFITDVQNLFPKIHGNTVNIPEKGDTVIFDAPLIGFSSASDEIFRSFRKKEIIGTHFFSPIEWLPSAKTVVSFFLPFTDEICVSNRADRREPSVEWLYGRIEGQTFIVTYMTALKHLLESNGIDVCVPCMDDRFDLIYETISTEGETNIHVNSRWSERHAAYACGLGTFGLSRGLISEKGMAGRYTSMILSEKWETTGRKYTGFDDYCVRCGACMRNCPVQAITLESGKNNFICKTYLDKMKVKYSPRYGCGKCQVGVPCERRAPGLKHNMDSKKE